MLRCALAVLLLRDLVVALLVEFTVHGLFVRTALTP